MSTDAFSSDSKPFIIEHRKTSLTHPNQFVPSARVIVSPALRTSGLLAELPDAEAKTLLLMLTFLTPNGHIRPSLPELSQALKTSADKARKRLKRLEEITFEGKPLVQSRRAESGLETFTLASAFEETEEVLPENSQSSGPVYRAAEREAVIAHSRSRYANTRAEAERLVAAQYGQDVAETGEGDEGKARRVLLALGVSREQVTTLFAEHSLEDIQKQLRWLPHRGAKSPGRFVVAAIQNNYESPVWVRPEQAAPEESARKSQPGTAGEFPASQSMTADVFLEIPQDIESEKGAADAD